MKTGECINNALETHVKIVNNTMGDVAAEVWLERLRKMEEYIGNGQISSAGSEESFNVTETMESHLSIFLAGKYNIDGFLRV